MDQLELLNSIDEEDLGNAIYEAFMEDDNYFHEIGKSVIGTFTDCENEKEFELADRMLAAVCGWKIESLLNRIK